MVQKLPDWFTVSIAKEQRDQLPDWFLEAIGSEQRVEELDDNTVELHKNKAKGEFEAQLRNAVGSREAPRFGYDSWYGRGSSRGPVAPPKPPTQMKVKEVLEWQNTHNPPGPETTAIGLYQIVDQPNARTLSNLVRTMGLTGEELFTAELQDRMADTLMERRDSLLVRWLKNGRAFLFLRRLQAHVGVLNGDNLTIKTMVSTPHRKWMILN
jgi:hypothetical protein